MRARGAAAFAALASLPPAARAHAFGERYDLPAPLGYFVAGAAAAVALTFVVAIVSVRRERGREAPIADAPLPSASGPAALAIRALALAAFLLVIAAGVWGDPHPAKNLAPTVVWILGWVGLSLVCALIGNVWPAIDPWASLHCLLPRKPAPRPWPERWGARPAMVLFLVFAWLEVVDPLASSPSHLAALLLGWTLVNVAGMAAYGRDAWQRNADPLAVYFAVLGRFAPLGVEHGQLVLRPWARRLVNAPPAAPAAFVIAMLATVLFDGLLGTQAWRRIDTAFAAWASGWNDRDNVVLGTAGLLATFVLFFVAYRAACALTTVLVSDAGASRVAERFAPTLVPIAVAYLLAHNLSYLLVQGQGIIPLLSDPLGRGWNLFGTAGYTPAIGVLDARFGWYVATIAIVGGHVISVWLAHRVALRAWPQHRRAILGSLPLTLLMIALTATSLAIVADPLTRFRTPDPGYTSAPNRPSGQCENCAMKIDRVAAEGRNLFTGYGDGYVEVNGRRMAQSLIATPDKLVDWGVKSAGELTDAHIAMILALDPGIVLLGSGSAFVFPDPAVLMPLHAARIGVEVMDTRAACRTFNILLGEDRNVLAALIVD